MNFKSITFWTGVLFATALTFSCSSGNDDCCGYDETSSSSNLVAGNPSSSSGTLNISSSSGSGGGNPDVNGATGINPQLYVAPIEQLMQCDQDDNDCLFNTYNNPPPYTGNGVLKEIIRDYSQENLRDERERRIIDTVTIGTVVNGKMNLELYTPKEEYLAISDKKIHAIFELMLYNNAGEPVGRLFLLRFNSSDDSSIAFYTYSAEDMVDKDTWDLFPNQRVIFVSDIEFKKGWNIFYENDKYDYPGGERTYTLTKTTNSSILKGGELKWYLFENDAFWVTH